MSLDGTLWLEDNTPFMIFCHEWVQSHRREAEDDVTDGCFLYRTKTGRLLMIWSSFGEHG